MAFDAWGGPFVRDSVDGDSFWVWCIERALKCPFFPWTSVMGFRFPLASEDGKSLSHAIRRMEAYLGLAHRTAPSALLRSIDVLSQ